MTTKDTFLYSIETVLSKGQFLPYATNGLECDDELIKVGFKTFTIGDTRWFVFKPTFKVINWIMNFVFPLYKIPYGNTKSPVRIHSGFLAGYMSLRNEVHNIVRQDHTSTKFIFCGHSLGGALARIAAVDIQYNFHKYIHVYTAGSPNVGNAEFEKSFKGRIEHSHYYVTKGDPVPVVPPQWTGYKRYVRTSLSKQYKWRFWLNHLPSIYVKNLLERDTSKEIL